MLENHFGKGEIEITPAPFTNCGLRHMPLKDCQGHLVGYSLDQTEYIQALKPIVSSEVIVSRKAPAEGEK